MISMHLNDCASKAQVRETLAADAEQWLRERGMTEPPQAPGYERFAAPRPLSMREQITAETQQQQAGVSAWTKDNGGKNYERLRAKFTIQAARPDCKQTVTPAVVKHALRKLGVTQRQMALEIKASCTYMSNILSEKTTVSEARLREILAVVWRLAEEQK
jgi:hypothetical protein